MIHTAARPVNSVRVKSSSHYGWRNRKQTGHEELPPQMGAMMTCHWSAAQSPHSHVWMEWRRMALYLLLCCHPPSDRTCGRPQNSRPTDYHGCPRHKEWTWKRGWGGREEKSVSVCWLISVFKLHVTETFTWNIYANKQIEQSNPNNFGLRQNKHTESYDKIIKTERCPWKSVSGVLVYEPQTTKTRRQGFQRILLR